MFYIIQELWKSVNFDLKIIFEINTALVFEH